MNKNAKTIATVRELYFREHVGADVSVRPKIIKNKRRRCKK